MIPIGILTSAVTEVDDGIFPSIVYSGSTVTQSFEVVLSSIIPAGANRLLIEVYGNGGGGSIGGGGGGGYAMAILVLGSVTKLGIALAAPSLATASNVRSGGFGGTVLASVLGTSGQTAPAVTSHVGAIRQKGGNGADAGGGAGGSEGDGGNASGSTRGTSGGGRAGRGGATYASAPDTTTDFGGGRGANFSGTARAGFSGIVLTPYIQPVAP